jgi:hypothetical protein
VLPGYFVLLIWPAADLCYSIGSGKRRKRAPALLAVFLC